MSMFEFWLPGDGDPVVKSGIGLIDVDLFLVFDDICEVTRRTGSVSSAEVLNEMLSWGVSKKLLNTVGVFSLMQYKSKLLFLSLRTFSWIRRILILFISLLNECYWHLLF